MVILCSEALLVWGKVAVFQTAQMDIKKRWTPQVDTKNWCWKWSFFTFILFGLFDFFTAWTQFFKIFFL